MLADLFSFSAHVSIALSVFIYLSALTLFDRRRCFSPIRTLITPRWRSKFYCANIAEIHGNWRTRKSPATQSHEKYKNVLDIICCIWNHCNLVDLDTAPNADKNYLQIQTSYPLYIFVLKMFLSPYQLFGWILQGSFNLHICNMVKVKTDYCTFGISTVYIRNLKQCMCEDMHVFIMWYTYSVYIVNRCKLYSEYGLWILYSELKTFLTS